MLIGFLIVFFIFLLVYQIFLVFTNTNESFIYWFNSGNANIVYQTYNTNSNPLILAQQNAGNIEYLKEQMAQVNGLDKEVQDISANVVTLNQQVTALVQAQANASQQLVGNKPLAISGTSAIPTESSVSSSMSSMTSSMPSSISSSMPSSIPSSMPSSISSSMPSSMPSSIPSSMPTF